jgi:hypothetical protein
MSVSDRLPGVKHFDFSAARAEETASLCPGQAIESWLAGSKSEI